MLNSKQMAIYVKGLRTLSYTAVVLLTFCVSPLLSASEATSDVPGSQDVNLIKRYPRSHIIQFEQETADLPYRLILGSLKKINNVLSPKKSQQIEGKLTRLTYRIPDGSRSDEVSDYFSRRVLENKGEVIFHCQGRDCGSSNYWANTIFRRAVLYGPEQFQNFFVARFGEVNTFVSIYTAQRGNKRLYAHLEIVKASRSEVETDPKSLLSQLQGQGVYLLSGVDFDANHHLTQESASVIAVAATAINLDDSLQVYVVGHLQGSGSLQSLLDNSRRRADEVVSVLTEKGVNPSRVSAQGVGPLSPAVSSTRIELVLIR